MLSRDDMIEEVARLRAEVMQCATELVEAANLIRPNYPSCGTIFEQAAKRAAQAAEFNRASYE